MLKKIQNVAFFALGLLVLFAATAFAANATNPADESLGELARQILDAVKNGQGWLAAALSVIVALGLVKRYVPKDSKAGKVVHSDLGAMVMAFVLSFAGAVATAAVSFTDGSGMSWAIALAAGKVGVVAIGGFMILHKLALMLTATKWWTEKAPTWLKTAVALVLALIGSSAVKKAEAAGAAALKANPPTGVDGVVGKAREVE